MKQLQNNFTTPEQSKRLLELGLPADSADCTIQYEVDGDAIIFVLDENETFSQLCNAYGVYYEPCWSVGRLIEIMKICVMNEYNLIDFFDNLRSCIFQTKDVVMAFDEYADSIDFSKLED